MGKLIRFELRKIFHSKYFYIILGVCLLFTLSTGIIQVLLINYAKQNDPAYVSKITAYTFTKDTLSDQFTLILGIFVAMIACEDQALGTNKNIISKGYSRPKAMLSKYFVSLWASLGYVVANIVLAVLFGLIAFGEGNGIPKGDNLLMIILGQLLIIVTWHALYFFISYSIGKTGGAIAVNIVGPTGVTLVLTIVDTLLKNNEIKIETSNYWIGGLANQYFGNGSGSGDLAIWGLFILLGYIALFIAGTYFINRRKEIK